MQTNSCIIDSTKYKILTKNINSLIEKNHQKEFIQTLAGDNNYIITSKTKSLLLYNPHLKQYEIVLFECNEKDFILECELFSNAFDLFDIQKDGYRVFIYKRGIYVYKNSKAIYFKTFESDFTIDELSDYIGRNYGIYTFEFTYIKQDQFDKLKTKQIEKSNFYYITFENNFEFKILLAFVATITLSIAYILFMILNKPHQISSEQKSTQELVERTIEVQEKYQISEYINELFLNLNKQQIILQSINIEQNLLKAILKSENKEKLFEFASKYDNNLAIKKIIYDNLTNHHIMEIEFVIEDKGIL
ncbi:hypothetical protein [Arcobacter sp. FWKO B]|uniref:hypothetical protein n=1 Tax=Arcobacter sp. FWKO B TaxID=2593672 RepID=UPI0018A5B3C5|nr:hypothetical protein [Arcobacter sp. FWKO B]QOG12576.1 hypothetical protein FWKOB_07600 [Arcobacter sp. FWKO B]